MRTRLQHAWATGVETPDLLTEASVRNGGGEEACRRFFLLAAGLFAIAGRQPLPAALAGREARFLHEKPVSLDSELHLTDRFRDCALPFAGIRSSGGQKGAANPVLIWLRTGPERSRATLGECGSPDMTGLLYDAPERRIGCDPKEFAVLVRAGERSRLREAYPNCFLDASAFLAALNGIRRAF